MAKKISKEVMKELLRAQCVELTEHTIYSKLAARMKHKKNKKVLQHIAKDELSHYNFWKKYTKQDVKVNKWTVFKHLFLAKIFGTVFSVKLMERKGGCCDVELSQFKGVVPNLKKIKKDNQKHEQELIALIKEERLDYVGSIVLGLNDALVELTGVLAGLTLAFRDAQTIGIAGLITGIAASLSMAASEFLSTQSEETTKKPVKAAFYTGLAYFLAVILLVLPFLFLSSVYLALGVTLAMAILIIFTFSYYVSVTKEISFKKRFLTMAAISLGVAGFSFLIGYLLRGFVGL